MILFSTHHLLLQQHPTMVDIYLYQKNFFSSPFEFPTAPCTRPNIFQFKSPKIRRWIFLNYIKHCCFAYFEVLLLWKWLVRCGTRSGERKIYLSLAQILLIEATTTATTTTTTTTTTKRRRGDFEDWNENVIIINSAFAVFCRLLNWLIHWRKKGEKKHWRQKGERERNKYLLARNT